MASRQIEHTADVYCELYAVIPRHSRKAKDGSGSSLEPRPSTQFVFTAVEKAIFSTGYEKNNFFYLLMDPPPIFD